MVVDVATLQPFGHFLYVGPPWATKNSTLFNCCAESLHFYGTLAHLEAESLHFYGTLAHLVSAWRGSKTVPGRRETKKTQFEQNFNLKMVVLEQPSKKRKSCPPNNSDQPVALEGRLEGEYLHFLRSVWLLMSPLCSRLAIFYKSARPGRQKIAPSSNAAQNICIFCGQCGCGCRHSAAV